MRHGDGKAEETLFDWRLPAKPIHRYSTSKAVEYLIVRYLIGHLTPERPRVFTVSFLQVQNANCIPVPSIGKQALSSILAQPR